METPIILAHDIGTTGNKACLYKVGEKIELIGSYLEEYPLLTPGANMAEQRGEDWWNAICTSTRKVMEKTRIDSKNIVGISFCTQMQGAVFVDKNGELLRNPIIWLDGRATDQFKRFMMDGVIKIESGNIFRMLEFVKITGGAPGSGKDPTWKYHWVKENEPEIFNNLHKFLDVKDYLILKCTGNYKMTYDSANVVWMFDTRPKKLEWSKVLCDKYGFNMDHLPEVIASHDTAGTLTEKAANEMGLTPGTPVFGGGGDISMIMVGSGSVKKHETHIYVGTSGWVASNIDKRHLDIKNLVAPVISAIPGFYTYIAEQETAGICLQWVRDHLAKDEIGMYLDAKDVCEKSEEYESLYDFLNQVVLETEPGSGNVIFTPWLHGNRCPREDPNVRGMFFNLGLNTGKRQLIRAVLEGVAFHLKWMLDAHEDYIKRIEKVRFVGGGAKSDVWCQILADITEKKVEVIENPQNAGAIGATIACSVGLGLLPNFQSAAELIPVAKTYYPNPENSGIYRKLFSVFKELFDSNKKLFNQLNK